MVRTFLSVVMIFLVLTSCKDDEEEIKSNLSDLISFSVKELSVEFHENTEGWSAKCESTDNITALTAVFEVSPKATVSVGNISQSSGVSVNNFTSPLTYTVRAEDGSKSNYIITITKHAAVLTYSIVELPNVVFAISSDSVVASVVHGTDFSSSLTAQFSTTPNSKLLINGVEQVTGVTKNSFISPIHAQISDEDGELSDIILAIKEAPNKIPTAVAGSDKIYNLSQNNSTVSVTLDGSLSSDFEGDLSSYQWKSGGGSVIATGAMATADFSAGTHVITLVVTDKAGATASDEVTLVINPYVELIPVDGDASTMTKSLYNKLSAIANSQKFIFGQEFPLSFKLNGIRTNISTSDCKDVAGDHPGVYGIDPHYLLYKGADEKQIHINEAKHAYQNGSVVTMEFHQLSRFDKKIYYSEITNPKDKSLMYDIVNDLNDSKAWYLAELDQVLTIINSDLGFPVVFRPLHEMDGGWFWWGTKATNHTPQLYQDFYKLTVEYMKAHSNLVLFAWSSNDKPNAAYYPGDDFVDMVGFDMYSANASTLKANLIELSDFAASHNKVAALTEVGYSNDFIKNAPTYWNDVVLKAVSDGGSQIRIAWALAWFNAPWKSSQSDLFIPDNNSIQKPKDSFKLFRESEKTLFQEDVKLLNIYQ